MAKKIKTYTFELTNDEVIDALKEYCEKYLCGSGELINEESIDVTIEGYNLAAPVTLATHWS